MMVAPLYVQLVKHDLAVEKTKFPTAMAKQPNQQTIPCNSMLPVAQLALRLGFVH